MMRMIYVENKEIDMAEIIEKEIKKTNGIIFLKNLLAGKEVIINPEGVEPLLIKLQGFWDYDD